MYDDNSPIEEVVREEDFPTEEAIEEQSQEEDFSAEEAIEEQSQEEDFPAEESVDEQPREETQDVVDAEHQRENGIEQKHAPKIHRAGFNNFRTFREEADKRMTQRDHHRRDQGAP